MSLIIITFIFQAAEYGLQVLEEKQLLQQKFEELEFQFEQTQHELDTARHEFEISKNVKI